MHIIKPEKLKKGDLIGLVTPASTPGDLTRIDRAVSYLEKLGYRTIIGKNVGKRHGYLAGTNAERLEDLHGFFANKNVKAIFSLRGGYGSGRMLDKLDFELIRQNPKIFVGYSDITSLQMAMLSKCGLVTFAGPMPAVDFHGDVNKYTEEIFWETVTNPGYKGKAVYPDSAVATGNGRGKARGRLTGGNLALYIALMGTGYLPFPRNYILLFEDVSEPPYRIDRMLNTLKLAGVLQKAKGLIFGQFTDMLPEGYNDPTLTLEEVYSEYVDVLESPVLKNFPHGHVKEIYTVPWGLKAEIDSDKGLFKLLESAVI